MKKYLALFLALIALQIHAQNTIVLQNITPSSNWYEVAGVGRVTNKTGNAFSNPDWASAGTCSLKGFKTGSSNFTVQTYMSIYRIIITGSGSSNRNITEIKTGSSTSSLSSLQSTQYTIAGGNATYSFPKETCDNAVTITFLTPIAANQYINFTLTGNLEVMAVELVPTGGSNPPTPTLSSNADLASLSVSAGTLTPAFAAATTSYSVTLPAGTTTAPTVSATKADSKASLNITQATALPGNATVVVTAENGTTKTYTIAFSVASTPTPPTPPTTTLTLHEPEVYEAPDTHNGYNGTLAVYNNYEYEVYYVNRNASSQFSVNVSNADKTLPMTTNTGSNSCEAQDGWFVLNANGASNEAQTVASEFQTSIRRANIKAGNYLELHIKGYDQFSFFGCDKKDGTKDTDKRYFEVYIDGVKQPSQFSTSWTVRRYDITTGEHVIRVSAIGTEESKLLAFSLRLAYVPKLKWIIGNDSTQKVRQTENIRPITYYLKNRISDAELSWTGTTPSGITLLKGNNDTLQLTGTANCPNGTYQYTISAKDASNEVVSSVNGKFTVISEIKAQGDTNATVYLRSPMPALAYRCYAFDTNDVTWTWQGGSAPAGLSFTMDATTHVLSLGGTPTVAGVYRYTISVAGGNSVSGTITVLSNEPTIVPGATKTMLYLFKTEKNGLYNYLTTQYNYFARPAGAAMQAASDYSAYDFIVISEDVDANNPEVLQIIRSLNKPVLNQKIFTYTTSRLGWGDPDNGSMNNTEMHIIQTQHPIFSGMPGSDIEIVSSVENRQGLMPVSVSLPGSYCLATAIKRGEDYFDDGDPATFIHEVPASLRGGSKYLTLPLGSETASKLTAQGKQLVRNMIDYLCGTQNFSATAELRITSFEVNGVYGDINEPKQEITINLPAGTDLTALTPQITLADATTFVTPASGETVDLSDLHYGVRFTVSDYINQRAYTVRAKVPNALDDLSANGLWMENHLLHNEKNEWLNIYSVSGNLITTTNSDYDFTPLPYGMYLIVSESATIKVIR